MSAVATEPMSDSWMRILAPDGSVTGELPALSDEALLDLMRSMLRVRCGCRGGLLCSHDTGTVRG